MKHLTYAKWFLFSLFAGNGLLFGYWAVHIPLIQKRFSVDAAQLGLLLLLIAGGSALTMLTSGKTLSWFGSKKLLLIGATGLFALLPVMMWTTHLAILIVAMGTFGIANGLMDVAMNEQAIRLEEAVIQKQGKPILSGLHGAFSLGGLTGASSGYLSLKEGSDGLLLAASLCIFGLIFLWVGERHLLAARQESHEEKGSWRISKKLVLVAGMAFLVLLSEGAIADWSAVYLEKAIGVTPSRAALGYAIFSLAMAVGRFGGDYVRARAAAHDILTFCGIIATVGMSMVLWKANEPITLIGFGLLGLGFSNIVPILFGASNDLPDTSPAMGLSIIVSCGYLGFLSGPVVIGFLIQHAGLTPALSLIAVCSAVVAICASIALANKDY
ncbi:MFS transporter [Leeia sp. TBRC 13508]|uniref:MFS transporter n=1 Tax=Leeia speluncae TaxID=2884804 RepID=A0ABS8DAJ6_9NEIS|nr:MFS transporter [Leeia speluncae]MCB6185187.1 MFS transporter [Leeia speluncae]